MRTILLLTLLAVAAVWGCGSAEKSDEPAFPPGVEQPAT